MKKFDKSLVLMLVLLLAGIGVTGCGTAQPTEQLASQPTATAQATLKPTDRPTAQPTAEPTEVAPTATRIPPAPTETPVSTTSPTPVPADTATPTLPAILTPDPRCIFANEVWDFGVALDDAAHESDFWQVSTPEEQGMNPDLLEEGMAKLSESPDIYSYLIVRNDRIVLERYFNGSSESDSRDVFSVSESVLSALVGIAIREGYLTSPHQRVSDILPDYFAAEANWPQKTIKLQGLLTQTDGLLWNDDDIAAQIEQGADWVQTMIDMDYDPGPGYHYNTGQSHITSATLANASDMNTCELAYRYLFDPLDISAEHWGQDPQGIFIGGWNLFLTPRELAKFGLLYLHGGEWQGEQVIPAEWVEESLSRQVEFYGTPYDYGYLWWLTTLDDHPVYAAVGHGGQMIAIIPDLDVIVVTTGDVTSRDLDAFGFAGQYYLPRLPELHGGVFFPSDPFVFIRQYVIPAVESGSSG